MMHLLRQKSKQMNFPPDDSHTTNFFKINVWDIRSQRANITRWSAPRTRTNRTTCSYSLRRTPNLRPLLAGIDSCAAMGFHPHRRLRGNVVVRGVNRIVDVFGVGKRGGPVAVGELGRESHDESVPGLGDRRFGPVAHRSRDSHGGYSRVLVEYLPSDVRVFELDDELRDVLTGQRVRFFRAVRDVDL